MANSEAGFGRQRGKWEEGCGHKETHPDSKQAPWALRSKDN